MEGKPIEAPLSIKSGGKVIPYLVCQIVIYLALALLIDSGKISRSSKTQKVEE